MTISLHHLVDFPEWIPTLAGWFQSEWGYQHPELTPQGRMEELQQRVSRNKLPITLIATRNSQLLGTYSLDLDDMDIRKHLSPWLASVFVNPKFRNQGIGTFLVRDAMARAPRMGISHLYLFTENQAQWYANMGWSVMEQTIYYKKNAIIMDFEDSKTNPWNG